MNIRLKTTVSDETRINELQTLLQVSSKAAVMRLAIAYSIRLKTDPRISNGIIKKYDIKNQNGNDYLRYTIFGDDEIFYKLIMEQSINSHLDDDTFFPEMTEAHLNRGITILLGEVKLSGSKDKYIKKLLSEKR